MLACASSPLRVRCGCGSPRMMHHAVMPMQPLQRAAAPHLSRLGGARMALKTGIVGLPNVGKSTLFNALMQESQAQAANFPFCTIEPNVGVVGVPDPKLQAKRCGRFVCAKPSSKAPVANAVAARRPCFRSSDSSRPLRVALCWRCSRRDKWLACANGWLVQMACLTRLLPTDAAVAFSAPLGPPPKAGGRVLPFRCSRTSTSPRRSCPPLCRL